VAYAKSEGRNPTVVFLGGFRSDMTGTKAMALEEWACRTGRGYLRFDYFGHGQSSGRFEDGTIGRWLDDSLAVIDAETTGKLVLVGSSMGGWLSLLAARARPERLAGLVLIAAAPDFTERMLLKGLSPEDRERAMAMAEEMDEVRRQLASVPAAVVIANHVMGLYELAAIHLSSQPPNFPEAQVAIDAMGAIVEGLKGRLGENEPTLVDALRQLQMAFVQLKGAPAEG